MTLKAIEYQVHGKTFKGYLAQVEDKSQPRPAVLIAPAWRGCDNFARQKAIDLAKLGYIGFAADLYGDGKVAQNDEEASALMKPLFLDRTELTQRIVEAYETLKKQPGVDSQRIGAIGFCFGGLTVIELLRSGATLKGVVSFHGLLGDSLGTMKAVAAQHPKKLSGSLLILHGYQDPLVSQEDIHNIQKEMSQKEVDWQMHIYGRASHAFTHPQANSPEHGLIYESVTANRAFKAMENFFSEIF